MPDKAIHFTVSFGLGSSAYVGGGFIESRGWRAAFGLGIALGAGAAKEIWDATGQGDPSWADMGYNLLGAVAGVAVAVLFDLADDALFAPTVPAETIGVLNEEPPMSSIKAVTPGASKSTQCVIRR